MAAHEPPGMLRDFATDAAPGEHLGMLVDQTPRKDLIRKPMHALADSYNAFLTKYEAYLRRLPEELDVRSMHPAVGMEKFFVRLRYP